MPELNDQKLPWSLEPRASVTETPKTLVEEALEQVEQENERLRAALKRMLLEFDFMIEANMIADVRHDVIFVEARAALEGCAP